MLLFLSPVSFPKVIFIAILDFTPNKKDAPQQPGMIQVWAGQNSCLIKVSSAHTGGRNVGIKRLSRKVGAGSKSDTQHCPAEEWIVSKVSETPHHKVFW